MKTSLFYLLIASAAVMLVSCKDDGNGIETKKPQQSSCLLMSRISPFSSDNWFEYDSQNRLIKDSTGFEAIRFFYSTDNKLIYSIRPVSTSREELTQYLYIGNVLKEALVINIQNNDSFLQTSFDYEVDNQNRIVSISRYYYSGSSKINNGKNTFEYNSIGDIAEQVTYFSNGGNLTPSVKNVYEYSESQSDPTLNYLLFQNILLNRNKKLVKKNSRFNYNSSLNAFSTTPSQVTTTEIALGNDNKPELRQNNSSNGVLTYKCN